MKNNDTVENRIVVMKSCYGKHTYESVQNLFKSMKQKKKIYQNKQNSSGKTNFDEKRLCDLNVRIQSEFKFIEGCHCFIVTLNDAKTEFHE